MKAPELAETLKPTQQGAATIRFAATSKELESKDGMYLEDCSEAEATSSMDFNTPGYSKVAFDPPTEQRLWKDSLKMVGLEDDLS